MSADPRDPRCHELRHPTEVLRWSDKDLKQATAKCKLCGLEVSGSFLAVYLWVESHGVGEFDLTLERKEETS